ncbi:MAG TPA: hypothetical protein VFC14_13650 [Burkholderiales bacterium]|jgi:hypothetical protein|nr:hypothetical protein [Burkholderiales bacterium]
MNRYGNNLDVSNSVDVTNPADVSDEVARIYVELYPGSSAGAIDRAFADFASLYRGACRDYHACDTPYHDIQHVLDVTLAMARLMDGYERMETGWKRFGAPLFRLGIVTALFHDVGYLRAQNDTEHRNGAELTLTHVSRGSHFLRSYLPQIGMGDMAEAAAGLIHFTGFEIPVANIRVPSLRYRLLGTLLGSADIIAQMADRCYLEKCRDRLYPEFVAGGIARKRLPDGQEDVVFESGDDLVKKTPKFFEAAVHRLDKEFGSTYHYGGRHFGGENPYVAEIHRNVRFAEAIGQDEDTSALKRVPPSTLVGASELQESPSSSVKSPAAQSEVRAA